ncbi:DUF937 domain-containing protein [Ornithinimicrobium flavum]|uniref:DUF937 domain-containing protein n=1 Tax=Ornithinimicrobium flavum TaxID=1288636 RepID=UPI001931039B|nr:DUF937 domain-containing protein [Ornithinimicrobium flavum]
MIDQLMRAIPTEQIAQQLGEDPAATRQAVQASLPALLGGLTANAQSRPGAESLLDALGQHQDDLADNPSVDRIDTQDGEKIVGHVFGGNTDSIVNQLGGIGGGASSGLVRKLLPILAPIVLSWLAKQVTGAGAGTGGRASFPQGDGAGGVNQPGGALGQGEAAPRQSDARQDGGMDMTSVLQDVLGSALGGATGQRPQAGSGNILGDVLGGILGGRR